MISTALRYPFDAESGRAHFLGITGALLGTTILLRFTIALFPVVLAVVPLAGAFVATSIAAGIGVEAFLRPNEQLPGIGSLFRTGVAAVGVVVVTLLFPVLLLLWTVLSYGGGETPSSGFALFFLLGSTTAIVAFLAATYVLPALVARTGTDGIRSVTTGRPLRSIVMEVPYLQGWTVGFALATLGWWIAIAGVLSRTFVGLLSILFGAYCLLAAIRAVGMGYAAVPGIGNGA